MSSSATFLNLVLLFSNENGLLLFTEPLFNGSKQQFCKEMIEKVHSSVYVWGSAAQGALGCQGKPTKVELVPRRLSPCCTDLIRSHAVLTVAAGNGLTTLITDRLAAYSFGKSPLKNCGVKARKGNLCQCIKIPIDGIAGVAHGKNHSIAIVTSGEVFVWGDISHCIVGSKSTAPYRSAATTKRVTTKPRKLLQTNKQLVTTKVACGENHTCILRNNETMLTFGIGRNSIRFREISSGHNHCAAISSNDGAVYTWGWGKNGRLGHGDELPRDEPTRVEALAMEPFSTIACGYAHTLAASEGGSVYGFGWNGHNQISGTMSDASDFLLPVLCLKNQGVLRLSCGFAHSAAITSTGRLLSWGMNEDAQCGTGDELKVLSPRQIDFDEDGSNYVVDVSCGHSHTVCIKSNVPPLQWMRYVVNMQKQPLAAKVLNRFARCCLFRIRLSHYIKRKEAPRPNEQIIPASPEVVLKQTADTDTPESKASNMSSSLSSHTSWSDDPHDIATEIHNKQNNNDELARRLIEMRKMDEEEQRSQAYMAHLRAIREKAMAREKLAEEKRRTERELEQMQKEDLLSKEASKIRQRKDMPKSAKSKANLVRNARTNDQIQKAATRLKEARERKELQSKAKVMLPSVNRKLPSKLKQNRRALRTTNAKVTKYTPDAAHLQRRQKLLKQRARRLQTKEQQEKEADLARKQKLQAQKERERIQAQQKHNELAVKQQREEEAQRLKRLQRDAKMKKLEKELLMKESLIRSLSGENKENEAGNSFRDVDFFTRNLYGQR